LTGIRVIRGTQEFEPRLELGTDLEDWAVLKNAKLTPVPKSGHDRPQLTNFFAPLKKPKKFNLNFYRRKKNKNA
jgi:hypothetical protein